MNRDPNSLLQLALPIEEVHGKKKVEDIRRVQLDVENALSLTKTRLYAKADGNLENAENIIKDQKANLLKLIDGSKKSQGEAAFTELSTKALPKFRTALDKANGYSAGSVQEARANKEADEDGLECQRLIGNVEEAMIPASYAAPVDPDVKTSLPKLNGRAVVDFVVKRGPESESGAKDFIINEVIYKEAKLRAVVDGWSAPITAGNFIDLVDKGFYDGLPVIRGDNFCIQTGDNGDKEGGYRPKEGGPLRRIPLEFSLKGQKAPIYGETIDDADISGKGKIGQEFRLPFQAEGTLVLARKESDENSASSQFYWFLFDSDMTPAGKNFLDGRYAVFGYTVKGDEFLREIKKGDIVVSAKVVEGVDKLVRPKA